jgi:hypothetical protein
LHSAFAIGKGGHPSGSREPDTGAPVEWVCRRRMLKHVGVGVAVAWTAPVLTSIRTPAFAQASPACTGLTLPRLPRRRGLWNRVHPLWRGLALQPSNLVRVRHNARRSERLSDEHLRCDTYGITPKGAQDRRWEQPAAKGSRADACRGAGATATRADIHTRLSRRAVCIAIAHVQLRSTLPTHEGGPAASSLKGSWRRRKRTPTPYWGS